ncbi:serine hydrolase domain-containing protein [Winogradskyella flava]|uniref:serine hydrolase domain-containing protein n=1 Tax=Winogradskyella flava TaxID=1884876 RepID=UPI002491D3C1|nr:serine hydrolase domain-containing protein [Winogradskyella flava]
MLNKTLLGLAFLIFISSLSNAQEIERVKISKSTEDSIDSIFYNYDNSTTPGVSVGFIQNGKLIFSKEYGMADLEHNIPIDSSSVFSLASVSKQFTAFAILLLERDGKLSLDDDIKLHLPNLNDFGEKITLRHLASHNSGIRDNTHLLGLKGYTPDNVITKKDALQIIYDQTELNFEPGKKFNYTNSGYVLLAEVVEKVSGKSFSAFMQENVFAPLEMESSFVMDDYHRIVKNRANSYEIENGHYVNAPANYSYYGSTNLYTSLTDLTKWTLNFSDHKVGDREIIEKMSALTVLNDGTKYEYGLGQFVGNFNGLEHIYHSGGEAGYRAFLGRFPEQDAAVLLLSNNNTIDAQGKALELANLFLNTNYKNNKITANKSSNFRKVKLSSSNLNKYSGSYINPDGYLIREIFVRNDTLIYSRQEQNGRETYLMALNNNTFQFGDNENIQALFTKNKKGESIAILVNGEEVELYSKYAPKEYSAKELNEFTGNYYSKELNTSYFLEVRDEILIISHPKMDTFRLQPIKLDSFVGSSWQFRSIEFKRDKSNQINSFRISSGRAQNVLFEKQNIK